jgi:hypothetical protein
MGIFSGLFSSKKRKTQSAVIYLDPVSLGQQIYGQFDLATLEDRLQAALASSNAGVVEGNESTAKTPRPSSPLPNPCCATIRSAAAPASNCVMTQISSENSASTKPATS